MTCSPTSGSGFDHDDRLLTRRHDEVELRLPQLLVGRIDDVLSIDQTDPDTCDRRRERDIGKVERSRCPGNRQDVRIVLVIGRNDH